MVKLFPPEILTKAQMDMVKAEWGNVRTMRSQSDFSADGYRFKTREQALLCVAEYIEDFYNPRCRHSALGNRSPMQFEMECLRTRIK